MFIHQLPWFVNPDCPNHVCKLKNIIYGLKQAPRTWFAKLTDRLLALGFQSSRLDSSLFVLHTSSNFIYVLIYMDDIIVTGSSSQLISHFISSLSIHFPVKDLGSLHFFF